MSKEKMKVDFTKQMELADQLHEDLLRYLKIRDQLRDQQTQSQAKLKR